MRYTRKQKRQGTTQKKAWGYHLIIDAAQCDPDAIRSKETIRAFVKELVKEIDMVAYGAPRIVKFGVGQTAGYTLVQLIQTSNITAHFSEETNNVYFDLFSCKSFHPKIATKVFDEYFAPHKKTTRFFKRQA